MKKTNPVCLPTKEEKNSKKIIFARLRNQAGFTLIEILVVIFIIGILVSLLLSNILGARQRSEDLERKSELNQLKTALRLYYNDNQGYPAEADFPEPNTSFASENGNSVYMKQTPDSEYQYFVDDNREQFRLTLLLDNLSDKDIQTSQTRCPKLTGMGDYTSATYVVCED